MQLQTTKTHFQTQIALADAGKGAGGGECVVEVGREGQVAEASAN